MLRSMFLLLPLLLLFACPSPKDKKNTGTGLVLQNFSAEKVPESTKYNIPEDGTYQLFCQDASHPAPEEFGYIATSLGSAQVNIGTDSYRTYLIKKNKRIYIALAFNTGDCTGKARSDDVFATDIVIGCSESTVAQVYYTCATVNSGVRPLTSDAANFLNSTAFCGYTSWAAGQFMDVMDQNCQKVKSPKPRNLFLGTLVKANTVVLGSAQINKKEGSNDLEIKFHQGSTTYTAPKVDDFISL